MRLVLGGERVEIGFEGWARGKGGEGYEFLCRMRAFSLLYVFFGERLGGR